MTKVAVAALFAQGNLDGDGRWLRQSYDALDVAQYLQQPGFLVGGENHLDALFELGIIQFAFPDSPSRRGVIALLIRDFLDGHAFSLEIVQIVEHLPFVRLLAGIVLFHFMDYAIAHVQPIELDMIQLDFLVLTVVAGLMDDLAKPDRIRLLLHLNIVRKKPQLALANQVVIDLRAGVVGSG